MRSIGLFTWYGYRIPIPDRIRLLRQAGFTSVLHWWDDSHMEADGLSKEAQTDLLRREGLRIENAHLQFDTVNDLWLDTLDGQALLERYLADIDGLAEHDIPVAVMHISRGFSPPPVSAVGMRRVRSLMERAERRAIRVAMENVRNNDALRHILDAMDSPMLGLCYDSGHDFAWSKTPYALLKQYGERLFAVHLHDNRGELDEHLPPGEGGIDWALVREGIDQSAYIGSYTLEGDSMNIPNGRTPQEHLRRLHEGATRHLYKNP